MKYLLFTLTLVLSITAHSATLSDTIEYLNGSGSFVAPPKTNPFTCPTNSICVKGDYALAPSWDYLNAYTEFKFLHESADVNLSWQYNNVDPTKTAYVDDEYFTGQINRSGYSSFKIKKGSIIEFTMGISSTSPYAEIHYQFAFSNILEEGQEPPPPVVQPVPVPPALALMLPIVAGFTLRKLSVLTHTAPSLHHV